MSWNRPSADTGKAQEKGGHKNVHLRGVIAGMVVVLGAAVAWWMVTDDKGRECTTTRTRNTRPSRIQETKHQVSTNAVRPVTVASKVETKPEWREEYMESTAMRLKFSTLIQARTNEWGMVTERFRLPNGKTWRRVSDPPPLFENRCDQAIAMVLGDETGSYIPTMPGLDNCDLDEEFKRGLVSPIKINDNDSAEVAVLKTVVKEARAEIAKMIKAGDTRSIGEILQEHIDLNNRRTEMWAEVVKQLEKVRKDEGEDFAREYLDKANESLISYGVPPIEGYFDKDTVENEGEGK